MKTDLTNGYIPSFCESFILDSTVFIEFKNVNDFTYSDSSFTHYTVEYEESSSTNLDYQYYLNIELIFSEAFAHFCYESVIYLSFFDRLLQKYPNLKLLIRKPKQFKYYFCNLLNIPNDRIVNSLDLSKPVAILFPSPESCLNDTSVSNNWKLLVQNLFHFIRTINVPSFQHSSYIIMPRQVKENFWGNPRDFPLSSIIQYFDTRQDGTIFHTDTVTDFRDQIGKVNSCDTIIISDGSPLLVNGLFAFEKAFLVVDIMTCQQANSCYLKYKYIISCIREINHNLIEYFHNESECLSHLK